MKPNRSYLGLVRLLLLVALASCTPAHWVTKRCAGFAPQLADTVIAGVGIAGAVHYVNDGQPWVAAGLAVGAMTVALAAALTGEQGPCTR